MAQLQRGENSYESGNIKKMIFDSEVSPALLKGEVAASMKNKSYTVEVSIDCEDGIVDATCSCPRGQAVCHHMGALCLHGHHNISVTDKTCVWNQRKPSDSEEKIVRISDIHKPKVCDYLAVSRQVSTQEIANFRKELGYSNPVGFTWLFMPEPSQSTRMIKNIEDIIYSQEYTNASDKEEFLTEKFRVNQDTIDRVEEITRGQSRNENWLIARKYRLTSSKFGSILSACRRNKFSKSLFSSLLEGHDLTGIQAVQWGRENEATAISAFERTTGLTVEPSGFFLESCGFLGASPDGFISERCLIEVKCPFKYRNEEQLKPVLKDKNYIIYFDNELVINENHNYYHQIQGALHIAEKDMCYLMVWIPNDYIIVRIAKNEEWKKNVNILKTFYVKQFIPFILS